MKQQAKRFLGMLLSLCLVLGMLPGVASAASNSRFTDVNPSDWYYDSVQYVSAQGLMSGTDYATFDPNGTTTRGMIATILYRLEGSPAYLNASFTDVPAGEWYAPAVSWASTYNIVSGYGDGKFGPDDAISREQLASILFRYSQLKKYNTEMKGDLTVYTDKGSISSYAQIPMSWAVGKGVVSGVGDGRIDPQGSATRAQVATMLQRYMENVVAKGNPLTQPATGIGFAPLPNEPEKVEDPTYTVTFYLNYGSNELYDQQTVKAGERALKPETPRRQDCTFLGWYVARNGNGRTFDFNSAINSDVTLYAQWSGDYTGYYGYDYDYDYGYEGEIHYNPYQGGYGYWYLGVWHPVGPSANTPTGSNLFEYNQLLDKDKDVEIYSLTAAPRDVVLGTPTPVTFTAEIFGESESEANGISIKDENNNDLTVTALNKRADGKYELTATLQVDGEKATQKTYTVKCGNATSSITIGFYKEYKQADFDKLDSVINDINSVMDQYLDKNGYLTNGSDNEHGIVPVDATAAKAAVKAALDAKGIKFTESGDDTFTITLDNGMVYLYSFQSQGTDAAGVIISNQPYKGTYNPTLQPRSDDASDGSARAVDAANIGYTFDSLPGDGLNTNKDGNYDAGEVDLDAMEKLAEADVVTWHGHGGYHPQYGSYMVTGDTYNGSLSSKRQADWQAGRIVLCGDNRWAITGGFVEKYVGDLTGHFLYLGTCSSGADMMSWNHFTSNAYNTKQLAQSFVDKGAVVIANSSTISTWYNTGMEKSVFDTLLEKNADGTYKTLSEALTAAKAANNSNGSGHDIYSYEDYWGTVRYAEARIYPDNETAKNYRLVEPTGAIAGSVMKADAEGENETPAEGALVRVYDANGTLVATKYTNATGEYNITLPVGDYVVEISASRYKTVKMSVKVTANNTYPVETLLLLEPSERYGTASGTVRNAANAEELVSGATFKLRYNWNNPGTTGSTVLYSGTTNAQGKYEIPLSRGIKVGLYTLEVSKEGFATTYVNIVLTPEGRTEDVDLRKALGAGEISIVLSWVDHPSDLDSHLVAPVGNGNRFHLFYPDAERYGGSQWSSYVQLDWDNTQMPYNTDPETVTIKQQVPGKYVYSVHNFSAGGNAEDKAMFTSQAVVRVYTSAGLIATYPVPTGSELKGTIWRVFELEVDANGSSRIIPRNEIGTGHDESPFFDPYGSISTQADNGISTYSDGVDWAAIYKK